ncbi:MAG: hypothetical protein FIB05_09340 [Betaproteobacteria bacterium]|nr:hypothetical protein [Betaproteobacteria bacterium]PWB58615.1 MAG: hypothetical protein C3F16_13505 [Betaproteobacteria bacterium]
MRAWALLLAVLLLPATAWAQGGYVRSLTVLRDKGAYHCDAVLFAPVPQSLAFDVLTDVDRMAEWVPNLRQSRVLGRDGNTVLIEQVGLAQFGMLSFNFSTERRLVLNRPTAIDAVQIRGSANRYNSSLRLTPETGGTRLDYHAQFEPGLLASIVVSREFMEHEIAEQFTAMIQEMVRRNAMGGSR